LPQDLPRVEVDEVCGLTVDREVGLAVRRQPVGREGEVVVCLRGGRVRALEAEVERRRAVVREVDSRRDGGRDDAEGDEEREPLAPAPALGTREGSWC
jgi:hypothetical protein